MTEKQLLERWNALVKEILSLTSLDETESTHSQEERKTQLEAEPEKWFRYYFPRYVYAPPAAFHQRATARLLQHAEWCEVRIWSRELAKSTRTMMEVLYLALVGHPAEEGQPRHRKKYVLLISNSLDNATRLLMPYKANLEFNRRIIRDYGQQATLGTWQASEFTTAGGIAFRALGAGQSPRGSRNEEARPDVLLFDDMDTDADCLNPDIIARKWRWIEEAAISTRSVSQPTTILFCGNRIAQDCCIARAVQIADHTDEVNIRDGDGRSSWPEKNSEADIDRVLSQKSYASAQKEYFNNPLQEGAVFKSMAYKPARPLREYEMLVCYTDPSYKVHADYKATVLVGRWKNEFHILKCFIDHVPTADMIEWHYQVMSFVGDCACAYYMEEVFMQDVLLKEVHDAGLKTGRIIPIRGDTRKKPDKFMRVETLLEPLNRNGLLYLNEHERQNPHMRRLEEQFLAFAPGARAHDDGPDAAEGAVWMINERLRLRYGSGFHAAPRPANENRW